MSDVIEGPLKPDEPSRRDLLGKGSVAAAVAAVASVAIANSASAANGDTITVGNSFTGTNITGLSGGTTFRVSDGVGVSSASIVGRHTAGGNGTIGVLGEANGASALSTGVKGSSLAGVGVSGEGGSADFKAAGSGVVWLAIQGVQNQPGSGELGSIARDNTGNLWYCHTANLWRKLGGASTAGAFHAINPVRVYDSRAALPAPGVLAPNLSRVVSVADGRNSVGAVTLANAVPAGATAVTFNVTATGTTGANFLSVAPGDAVGFTTSTLNWPGGFDIANASTVKIDASRQVKVFMGDNVGSSHFIIDITGYYL